VDDAASGLHGHELSQLQELPVEAIELAEADWADPDIPNYEGRKDDANRYAQWLLDGMEAPPIEAVETESGAIRCTDGHRRLAAARLAGKSRVLVWVSPCMDHPHGMRDAKGALMRVGMTYEGIHGEEWTPRACEATQEIERDMALGFFESERRLYGDQFDAEACVEDIHRQWGRFAAEAVEQAKGIVCQAGEQPEGGISM
jgi:hypothetical protein